MKNKIPPPALTLISVMLMVYLAVNFGGYTFNTEGRFGIGLAVLVVGLAIMASAGISFRRKKTTVNPFRPENTTRLVVDGLFNYSRNPMYLGMMFILFGVQIALDYVPNIVVVILFIIYMTLYQVRPEERALTEKFGDEYIDYMKRVRCWL